MTFNLFHAMDEAISPNFLSSHATIQITLIFPQGKLI